MLRISCSSSILFALSQLLALIDSRAVAILPKLDPQTPQSPTSGGDNRGGGSSIGGALLGSGGGSFVVSLPREPRDECMWRRNITDIRKVSGERQDMLEDCLYNYLAQREARSLSVDAYKALLTPPWEFPLRVIVNNFLVRQVDLLPSSSTQFNVHGDLLLTWNDSRLAWNSTDWKVDTFELHDNHEVWKPTFGDESGCGVQDGCVSRIIDMQLTSTGLVRGRLTFRYPSYCRTNYYRYPEETNDCCLYISMSDIDRTVKYDVQMRDRARMSKLVAVSRLERGREGTVSILTSVDTSVWKVEDRTVEVVKISELRSDYLQLCVHSRKEKGTLRIALRIPVTIATMLMLVSPLFGDLRTQAFVKMFTLTLQTICFLFLCSIAPPNGFGGSKPKLYTFYEFLFTVTFLSILVTTICLALCRLRRAVPASHNLYLAAKAINRFLCCIDPDPATFYQRQIDEPAVVARFDTISQQGESGRGTCRSGSIGGGATLNPVGPGGFQPREQPASYQQPDYSLEWQQVYVAANNLFSSMAFSLFCFVIIFDLA